MAARSTSRSATVAEPTSPQPRRSRRTPAGDGHRQVLAPAATSSHSAVSTTRRVRHPALDIPHQCWSSGIRLIRPRCGINPTRPVYAAGMRMDPAPSLAEAAPTRPAATAAAEPPLEPPGVRPVSHGLRVSPVASLSVNPQIASSGRLVTPNTIAPASRSRCTCTEFAVAGSVVGVGAVLRDVADQHRLRP